jgi:hypothetical protein
MSPATAPFLAATVLLGGAGVAKLHRPDFTARALASAGLGFVGHRRIVRLGAVTEVLVAVAALIWPGPLTGALVALAYLAFAGFVLVALRSGWPLSSCGCFGRPDSRPTYTHVVLNTAAAAAAAAWAAGPSRMAALFTARQPWHGVPLVLVALLIAGLAYLIWSDPVAAVRPLRPTLGEAAISSSRSEATP